jgi:hypothetical protein
MSNVTRESPVMRHEIFDYLNITPNTATDTFERMNYGMTDLGVTFGAQTDTVGYTSDATAVSSTIGYQTVIPYNGDLIKNEKVLMFLYEIGMKAKSGADADTNYIVVEGFAPLDGTDPLTADVFHAYNYAVAVAPDSRTGAATSKVSISGNLNAKGSATEGYFELSTKTFTAGEYTPA